MPNGVPEPESAFRSVLSGKILQVRINAHLKCFRSSHKHVRSVHESQPEAFQVDLDVNQKECLTLSCVRVHPV